MLQDDVQLKLQLILLMNCTCFVFALSSNRGLSLRLHDG